MKFPTYKELGEIAAKEALDTFEYKGKTLRKWIEIISAAELGTNLAEVGTDLVSRQAVKDIFTELYGISAIGSVFDKDEWADICETTANELPSVQRKILKYTGESLCLSCQTINCDGCVYEPVTGVQ